jgi:hypothetical protein
MPEDLPKEEPIKKLIAAQKKAKKKGPELPGL